MVTCQGAEADLDCGYTETWVPFKPVVQTVHEVVANFYEVELRTS